MREDTVKHSNVVASTASPASVLAESWFPAQEISHLIAADRRVRDPAYGAHRWWARRPPALMRGLLIGLSLPPTVMPEEFWAAFNSDDPLLQGKVVLDPFVGGGSTLVEAARLGATVVGSDIDPLAVRISRRALIPANAADVRSAGSDLVDVLRSQFAAFFPVTDGTPLHYFSFAEVTCSTCECKGLVYRDLVLARDRGLPGAVVRDQAVTAFCPICLELHYLPSPDRRRLHCCGKYHHLYKGTFTGLSYSCPQCRTISTHRQMQTGRAPRRLIAVEVTQSGKRRRLRQPVFEDFSAQAQAAVEWQRQRSALPHPVGKVVKNRHDDRPLSYGITNYEELFTPRQLIVIASAFKWIRSQPLKTDLRDALELAVSNSLTTNNRLCGYATDYGRLSALFTVRGYSLPSLAIELNPLHLDGGRGTLSACIERVARSDERSVRRYTWSIGKTQPIPRHFTFRRGAENTVVEHRNAAMIRPEADEPNADLAVFDPPYFDFIAYDELSDFHRVWLGAPRLIGAPLLPDGDNSSESFGLSLADCLRNILAELRPGRPLAFTYHSADPRAWRAIGIALDEAKLRVTAIWPVRSDGHMGHHSHPGNCEWDIVLVCRPAVDTITTVLSATTNSWIANASPFQVGLADQNNFRYALLVARSRFGIFNGEGS